MAEPKFARSNYYEVDLEPDVEYLWCARGRSASQRFCDDSHGRTKFQPKPIKVGEAMRLYLCGCKHTTGAPNCDGTHAGL